MAFEKIREGEAFKYLSQFLPVPAFRVLERNTWREQLKGIFKAERYVVKADEFFNKRAKQGYLAFASPEELEEKVKEMLSKVSRVVVQEFIEHEEELYLSFHAGLEENILFGPGGVEVESHWDRIKHYTPQEFLEVFPEGEPFLKAFRKGFFYLEMNPIVYSKRHKAWVPLGVIAKVDGGFVEKHRNLWKGIEVGNPKKGAEERVAELDRKSHASLKLKVLNPEGKLWFLVAGGGASVLYTDRAVELGYGGEIANYGEYSGNPTFQEVYAYTTILLEEMLKGKGKALIVGGGIANFTDVGKSFKAIAKALSDKAEELRERNIGVFVRRGGVREEEGLSAIRETLEGLGIYYEVYGRERPLTYALERAIAWMEGRA